MGNLYRTNTKIEEVDTNRQQVRGLRATGYGIEERSTSLPSVDGDSYIKLSREEEDGMGIDNSFRLTWIHPKTKFSAELLPGIDKSEWYYA